MSRRTNHQCGIDVIIVSARVRTSTKTGKQLLTAGEAAQQLMVLAKQHFPDSALAKCDIWNQPATSISGPKAANVLSELCNRDYDLDEFNTIHSQDGGVS